MTYKILHASLEYTYGVVSLRTVLTGLLPVLQEQGLQISIIPPYYEFLKYNDIFN